MPENLLTACRMAGHNITSTIGAGRSHHAAGSPPRQLAKGDAPLRSNVLVRPHLIRDVAANGIARKTLSRFLVNKRQKQNHRLRHSGLSQIQKHEGA
jgi:hypothetical protein